MVLGSDGSRANLIRVQPAAGGVEVHLDGRPLANEAVRVMAESVRDLARDHKIKGEDLEAVVVHGGNGRLPGLLARQLGLPPERVWSETPTAGNLGAASLPVAWAARAPQPRGPVIWTAVGAGLCWGAALFGGL